MGSAEIILIEIKSTVQRCEPEADIVLFGSRARGDADNYSDYDLIIITAKAYSEKEKRSKRALLNRKLVDAIQSPVDILLTSKHEFEIKSTLPGHVFRTAAREGILL